MNDRTFVMERIFKAPPAKVFAAFASAEALAEWWAPDNWTTETHAMDFQTGGVWHYTMTDGTEKSAGKTKYLLIDEPNELVVEDVFVDGDGNEMPDMPGMTTTYHFLPVEDNSTKLVATTVFATPEDLQAVKEMGMEDGSNQSWNHLEAYLANVQG